MRGKLRSPRKPVMRCSAERGASANSSSVSTASCLRGNSFIQALSCGAYRDHETTHAWKPQAVAVQPCHALGANPKRGKRAPPPGPPTHRRSASISDVSFESHVSLRTYSAAHASPRECARKRSIEKWETARCTGSRKMTRKRRARGLGITARIRHAACARWSIGVASIASCVPLLPPWHPQAGWAPLARRLLPVAPRLPPHKQPGSTRPAAWPIGERHTSTQTPRRTRAVSRAQPASRAEILPSSSPPSHQEPMHHPSATRSTRRAHAGAASARAGRATGLQ
mmetsp:Transcript_47861/g.158567  ORF Transcript_47861/g.158567 Transcript_47861/m.158567 type:complete len:283 (+) Transcript_47861:223-1071(+)